MPCPPKSASSQRGIALDLDTLRLLYRHELFQRDELRIDWLPSTPMFTRENGGAIDPNYLTHRFHKLVMAISRERPGDCLAGPQSGSQDRAQGEQRPPWYVTHSLGYSAGISF